MPFPGASVTNATAAATIMPTKKGFCMLVLRFRNSTQFLREGYATPVFFVSVACKRLRYCVSSLFATHTRGRGSVASKGLRKQHNYGNGVSFLAQSRKPGPGISCAATMRQTKERQPSGSVQSKQVAALQEFSRYCLGCIVAHRYRCQGRSCMAAAVAKAD